jgi:hypothetical protein
MEIIVYNPCPVRVLLSPILNHHKRDARAKKDKANQIKIPLTLSLALATEILLTELD